MQPMQALEVNMPSCVCSCLLHDGRDVKTSFIKRAVGSSENLRGGGGQVIIQAPLKLKKKVLLLFQSKSGGGTVLKWILRRHLKPPLNATI